MSIGINLTDILNLDASHEYEIEEVRQIKQEDKLYYAETILTKYTEGRGEYQSRKVPVEFLKYLRIGALISENRIIRNSKWDVFTLFASSFEELKFQRKVDFKYLESRFCSFHFKNVREDGTKSYEERYFKRLICYYEFETPIVLKGEEISYVTFPSFEIARFFLFGVKKFNESLIISDLDHPSGQNKIYNPKHTGDYDLNGVKHKYVCLRKEIEDKEAFTVGNIAFQSEYRKLAKNLQREVQIGQDEFNNPFFLMNIPWGCIERLECLGQFTKNQEGDVGLTISAIDRQFPKTEGYLFGRDNPGTRTKEYNPDLKESYVGRRKSKRSKKSGKDKTKEKFDPVPANESFEAEEVDFYSDFEDEPHESTKVIPIDQNFQAAKKLPPEKKEPKNYGVSSSLGGKEGTLQSISFTTPSDTDIISEDDYWDKFPEFLKKINEDIGGVSFYNGEILTSKLSVCRFQFSKVRVTYMANAYFVLIKSNKDVCVLVEFDQTEMNSFTMLFPITSDPRGVLDLIVSIESELINQEGAFEYKKLKEESTLKAQRVKRFRHVYEKRKQDPPVFYTPKEALEIYQNKVLKYLKTYFNK